MYRRRLLLGLFYSAAVFIAFPLNANALCVYGGQHFKSTSPDLDGRLYATTTLADEFADSAFVVRGTVLTVHHEQLKSDDPSAEPSDVYRVSVGRYFKGKGPSELRYFTENDSGMFPLEIGVEFSSSSIR